MSKMHVIGDIHGFRRKLEKLLLDAKLIDKKLRWRGADAQLWFVGDFFDRGPDGVGTVDLIMRLQKEAEQVGGHVGAVLGNHDVLILGACLMKDKLTSLDLGNGRLSFYEDWLRFGTKSDYERITTDQIDWLLQIPLMALLGDYLLIHADAPFYLEYGESIEDVNAAVQQILQAKDAEDWDYLQVRFSDRRWFYYDEPLIDNISSFLKWYGGQRLIHGHTPIDTMLDVMPQDVTTPYIYANDLCINVDGRIYGSGAGFVYELPPIKLAD